jgi:ribose 5-phosphate isomerase B
MQQSSLRVGLAADHAGYALKNALRASLEDCGYTVIDVGAHAYDAQDDYPDAVAELARALARGSVDRAVAICGSGMGACIAANKVAGVRAAPVQDAAAAAQCATAVAANMICLGARGLDAESAWTITLAFLRTPWRPDERSARWLEMLARVEQRRRRSVMVRTC